MAVTIRDLIIGEGLLRKLMGCSFEEGCRLKYVKDNDGGIIDFIGKEYRALLLLSLQEKIVNAFLEFTNGGIAPERLMIYLWEEGWVVTYAQDLHIWAEMKTQTADPDDRNAYQASFFQRKGRILVFLAFPCSLEEQERMARSF